MNVGAAEAVGLAALSGWLGCGRLLRGPDRSGRARPGTHVRRGWVVSVLGIAVLLAAAAGGARVGLAAGGGLAVAAVVRRLVARITLRRARQAMQLAVIELCDALAAELAAGLPTPRAVELACSADPVWSPVAAAARLGGDTAETLRALAQRPGAVGLYAVAAAWEVSARSGAALADVLDRVASALRDDQEARVEVSASLAPPRATARLLAVLPVFGLGLGASMGAHPVGFLLGSPVGLGLLGSGLVLALVGVLWVERLADAAEA